MKLGAKIAVEHISTEEANDYDKYLFDQFERLHQKLYLSEKGKSKRCFPWMKLPFFCLEKEKRFKVFKENLNRIDEYNEQEEGTAIYGITHLSDLNGLSFSFH